ncbi:MAG: site-specific DNA-methyltransferase, partial [Acidimicrobiales bacterium]|nr:site-specific DNA-methyltransferase [Acidimicrobiales bacterium]
LIQLYTYVDDLVLDPFMGAGTTLVAAALAGRRFVGYDTDAAYVSLARERVLTALSNPPADPDRTLSAPKVALAALENDGFEIHNEDVSVRGSGLRLTATASDANGQEWGIYVAGANGSHGSGISSSVAALKAVGEAIALRAKMGPEMLLMLATTALPIPTTTGGVALAAVQPQIVARVLELHAPANECLLPSDEAEMSA